MVITSILVATGAVGIGTTALAFGNSYERKRPPRGNKDQPFAHASRNEMYYVESKGLEITIKDNTGQVVYRIEIVAGRLSSEDSSNELWGKKWKVFSVVDNRWIASISLAKLGKSGRIDWLGNVSDGIRHSDQVGNGWLHKWYGWTKLTSQLLFRRFSNDMGPSNPDTSTAEPTESLYVASRLRGDVYEIELPQEGGFIHVHNDKFLLWRHAKSNKDNDNEALTVAQLRGQKGKLTYEITIDVSVIDVATALLISVISNFRDCQSHKVNQ